MEWLRWVLIGFTLPIATFVLGLRALRIRSREVWQEYTSASEVFRWITPALAVLAALPLTHIGLSPIRLAMVCVAPMLAFRTIDYIFAFTHYRRRIEDHRWTGKLVWNAISGWMWTMITPALIAL